MNVQAPGKSSAKRKGKQISFFGENAGTIQPNPTRQKKNGMLCSEAEVSGGPVNPQPPTGTEAAARGGPPQSVASDLGMGRERGAATDGTVPPNWAASVLIDHLPTKGGLNWQPACSWSQSVTPFCASSGGMSIIDSNAPGPFSHTLSKQGATTHLSHESLQRQQENTVSVSQLDLFGDAIKQMTEKVQLVKKQAIAKQVQSLAELQKQQNQLHHQLQHQLQLQLQLQHQQQHQQPTQSQHQQPTQSQHQHQQPAQSQHQHQQPTQSQQPAQSQHQDQHQQPAQSQHQHQQPAHSQHQQPTHSQHQHPTQSQSQHQQLTQSQSQQPTQSQHQQPHQPQHQNQHQHQNQPQHQNQLQPQHQPQHQNQLQPQHQPQHQNQPQPQHQHQNQPQPQHQHQNQPQPQHQHQQQYQKTQLLHQHQQQPQSNEALPHHQFFQFSYGQSQKQDLPPNSVLNIFHQAHQPSLFPLYSHQAQSTCQQHIFQQFFPHQQPPQSLGLQRVQMSQGSDSLTHQLASTAAQFQQPPETQVSKGLQRSMVSHKQERPSRQMATEFQATSAKRAQYSFKERKTKPLPFELQSLGNPSGIAENANQRWPQAYGPELQKLLNVPPNHCAQNQLKLFDVDLLQSKNVQANEKDNWSQKEHVKTQPSQDSRKSIQVPAQETASEVEGAADSVMQSTRKERTLNETNGLQSQQGSTEPLLNWNSSDETRQNDSQEESKRRTTGHSKVTAESALPRGRLDDGCLMPLVIPVSVPVRKMDSLASNADRKGDGESQRNSSSERDLSELTPSLLTTHRHRLSRGSGAELSVQEDDGCRGQANLTAKLKRRPRPEPLFIPPKPLNHVSVITYPPGTLYQSNLRSPVRLLDHPMDKNFQPPPYTPPPILSPMREGSGLYFNAFLSSSQPVTPRSTPKTCLSQSNTADTPPPVLSFMNETTPASIEPRINIGPQFQAEIPGLRDKSLAALDANHADLVFKPWEGHKTNRLNQQRVDELMTLACSSILPGGGTNQELTLHCLHESKGNILAALSMLLIKRTPRGRSRGLASYHYAGSDKWTSTEKKMFNKGLAAHKKDFFLVQKLVKTKTVAQCVEFYYTYKKQVKIGRNGVLIFGDTSASDSKNEEEAIEIDRKDSLPRRTRMAFVTEVKKEEEEDDEEEKEEEEEEEYRSDHKKLILTQAKVMKTEHDPATSQGVHLRKSHDPTYRCSYRPRQPAVATATARLPSRSEQAQSGTSAKRAKQSQENIFPCKKCGKVFSKVKSRSAHMKSHSVQEKKQREAELKSRIMMEEERTKGQKEYNDYSDCYQDM
ncbi:mitotic deacetylase-associated SANT domain protein isoform X2 [Heterodontus francisci]|uniref:mitotic deacetylase-associated SANT domain protein isoform X2 n=1 Tax=Heterodontus francisci TaxID=7792 RepID=UPI00355C47AE